MLRLVEVSPGLPCENWHSINAGTHERQRPWATYSELHIGTYRSIECLEEQILGLLDPLVLRFELQNIVRLCRHGSLRPDIDGAIFVAQVLQIDMISGQNCRFVGVEGIHFHDWSMGGPHAQCVSPEAVRDNPQIIFGLQLYKNREFRQCCSESSNVMFSRF